MTRRRRHAWLLRLLLVIPIDAPGIGALESVHAGGALAYGPGLLAGSLCLATLFAAPPSYDHPVEQPSRDEDDDALVVHAERWAPGGRFLLLVLGGLFVSAGAVALSWLGLVSVTLANVFAAASAIVAVAAGVFEDAAAPFTELRLTESELATPTMRIRLRDIADQRVVSRSQGGEINGTEYTRTELSLHMVSGAKVILPLPMHEGTRDHFLATLRERIEGASAAPRESPRLDDDETPNVPSTAPPVRLRGRAVTAARVYFRVATDLQGRRVGEVPQSGKPDFEIEVDGARVRVELSVDTAGPRPDGGGLFWYGTDYEESPVAFGVAVPEGANSVSVLEMRVSEGTDVEVWGRALETRRGEGGYRDRPATKPSEVAAVLVDHPPLRSRERVLLASVPAFAFTALSPLLVAALGARMPWASAHLLLAVIVAAAGTYLGFVTGPPTLVPLVYRVFDVRVLKGAAYFLAWLTVTVGLCILPVFDGSEEVGAARWLAIVAPFLFAAYPLLDLLRSGRGARRLRGVARALSSPEAAEGVVLSSTPVESKPDVEDRTLHVMLARRDGHAIERTVRLSASTWLTDLGFAPSERERVLVEGNALWASGHEPRSALVDAQTRYRRFRIAALALSATSLLAALRVYGWL